jgi:succinylglutamate desuccinylase
MRIKLAISTLLGGLALAATALGAEVLPTYHVVPDSDRTMQRVADEFEVLRKHDGGYEVVVPEGKLPELLRLAPEAKLLNPDMHADLHALPKSIYDVASMERRLQAAATRYPGLVKLGTYGTSRGGRPQYVLTMGQNPESPDLSKPGLMITAATHGDEVITVEVVLGLIDKLLAGYGTDARLTRMLDNTVIYWVPAVCVDGYAARSRYVEGRDPNRDYAWPDNPTRAPATKCIRDITAFFHDHPNIKGTMDFHAAASMIMYPWAFSYDHPDEPYASQMDQLTTYMAEANGFAHGTIAETIYVAKGSSADYYYWKNGAHATAVEVSHNFLPARAQLVDIVTENTESTWRFIEFFISEHRKH